MSTWTRIIFILVIGVCMLSRADQPASQPAESSLAEAKTTDEIDKAIEPLKGFGQIQSVEFKRWGHRVYAVWYCPFSGRGDYFLSAYYFDFDKSQWTRFIDRLVPSGGDLSAEMPTGEEIIFRGNDGKIAYRESVEMLSRERMDAAK